jgi:hypothetical protein
VAFPGLLMTACAWAMPEDVTLAVDIDPVNLG